MKIINVSWMEYGRLIEDLSKKIAMSSKKYTAIHGIPNGGIPIAVFLSKLLNLPLESDAVIPSTLIVDDISDTGATLEPFAKICDVACLFSTSWTKTEPTYFVDVKDDKDSYIQFPYEVNEENKR